MVAKYISFKTIFVLNVNELTRHVSGDFKKCGRYALVRI